MKVFLGQTNLSGNINGHFEILAKPEITTKQQAFEYWDKFFSPFNIMEIDVPSSVGNVDYINFDDIRDKYRDMKDYYDTKMVTR